MRGARSSKRVALKPSRRRRSADDEAHRACVGVLARDDLRLAVPALVVAEATDFVGRWLGLSVESALLHGIGKLDVEARLP
jgi:hypothetical protein